MLCFCCSKLKLKNLTINKLKELNCTYLTIIKQLTFIMSKKSFKITENTVQDEMDEYEVVMTPNAIPDLSKMSNDILELLDFIESDKMVILEKKYLEEYRMANTLEDTISDQEKTLSKFNSESAQFDKIQQGLLETKRRVAKLRKSADKKREEFEALVYGKYNSVIPMKIISLLIEQERYDNLNELLDMFERLKAVKEGKKDIHEEAEKFGEINRSKYVYPKFGGKEKFLEEMSKPQNKK